MTRYEEGSEVSNEGGKGGLTLSKDDSTEVDEIDVEARGKKRQLRALQGRRRAVR